MSDAYVQVAPDDTTGKKIQTYENTVGLNDVHAQAVVLVDSAGIPITPITEFLSANIARVDPSGSDSTGTVGDLSKPFLTVQAAINAIAVALTSSDYAVIDIGDNHFSQNLTIDNTAGNFPVLIFKGVTNNGNSNDNSIAYTKLTITADGNRTDIRLKDCSSGEILTDSQLVMLLDNANFQGNVIRSTSSGSNKLTIGSIYGTSTLPGTITADTTDILIYGMTADGPGGSLITSANRSVTISNSGQAQNGAAFSVYTPSYFSVNAPNGTVTVNDSLLGTVTCTNFFATRTTVDTLTASSLASLTDSRIGTNLGVAPTYTDVLLKGIGEGGTTGQIQAKASNSDFDVAWINSALTPNVAGIAGKILRSNGTNYIDSLATYPTASGTNGNVMTSDGTNWISIPIPATGGSVPTSRLLTIGGTAQDLSANRTWLAPGIVGRILRSDGSNYINSIPAFPNSGTVAGKVIIADGTNYVESTPTFPNASAAIGKFIRSDGTNWITSTPTLPTSAGVAGKILRSDGTNYIDTTATFPTTAGTNGNVLTSDGTNWASIAIPVLPTLLATNADAPASTINIAPVAGTNLVSKALTIAAGDQIRVEIDGTIVNNSTVNRTYTITCSIGGAGGLNVSLVDTAVIPASATNRLVRSIAATFGIKSSSSAWLVGRAVDYGGAALGAGSLLTASRSVGGSQQSSSNFTGLQTINITMGSNAAVPTQSFELTAYTIRQIATNP